MRTAQHEILRCKLESLIHNGIPISTHKPRTWRQRVWAIFLRSKT